MSDSSRVQLTYRKEAAFAEAPPANAAMKLLRFVSEGLDHKNKTEISNEIRSDRQRSDLILTGYDSGGDVSQEIIYGEAFDVWAEAALCGKWTGDVLQNGTTNRSFLLEKGYLDIGKFVSFRGAVVDSFGVDIAAGKALTMQTKFMAAQGYPTPVSVSGTTVPTDPIGNEVMRAGSLISLLDAGSDNIELVGQKVSRITFNVNDNLRPHPLATDYQTDDFGRGVMGITGTLETYFNDIDIYAAMKANSLFAFGFQMQDPSLATNNAYQVVFPRVKLSAAPAPISGGDSDVKQTLTFQALVDVAVGYSIQITRNIDAAVE